MVLVAALAAGEGGVVPLATSERFIAAAAEIGVVLLLLALVAIGTEVATGWFAARLA